MLLCRVHIQHWLHPLHNPICKQLQRLLPFYLSRKVFLFYVYRGRCDGYIFSQRSGIKELEDSSKTLAKSMAFFDNSCAWTSSFILILSPGQRLVSFFPPFESVRCFSYEMWVMACLPLLSVIVRSPAVRARWLVALSWQPQFWDDLGEGGGRGRN